MPKPRRQRRSYLIIIIVILAVILLQQNPWIPGESYFIKAVDGVIHYVFDPVQSVLVGTRQWVGQRLENYFDLVDMRREYRSVVERLAEVERLNLELGERLHVSEDERQLLTKFFYDDYAGIPARVIGHDPLAHAKTIWINVGRTEGVEDDLPVMGLAGLVGRIIDVHGHSSQVLLLIDPDFYVDALNERTRFRAMLRGMGAKLDAQRYPQLTQVEYLQFGSEMEVGDRMLTSGLGRLYPRGILIGRVIEVERDKKEVVSTSKVIPAVDLTKIESVIVLKPRRLDLGEDNRSEPSTPKKLGGG